MDVTSNKVIDAESISIKNINVNKLLEKNINHVQMKKLKVTKE